MLSVNMRRASGFSADVHVFLTLMTLRSFSDPLIDRIDRRWSS